MDLIGEYICTNKNKNKNCGLTPKGHPLQGERHSHDPHRQVSNQFFVDPPVDPRYQTFEQGLV